MTDTGTKRFHHFIPVAWTWGKMARAQENKTWFSDLGDARNQELFFSDLFGSRKKNTNNPPSF